MEYTSNFQKSAFRKTRFKKTDRKKKSDKECSYYEKLIHDEKILDGNRILSLSVFLNHRSIVATKYHLNFLFSTFYDGENYSINYHNFERNHFTVPLEPELSDPDYSTSNGPLNFVKKSKFTEFAILNLKYQLLQRSDQASLIKKEHILTMDEQKNIEIKNFLIQLKKLNLNYLRVLNQDLNSYEPVDETYLVGRIMLPNRRHSFGRIFQRIEGNTSIDDVAELASNMTVVEKKNLSAKQNIIFQKINNIVKYSEIYTSVLGKINL